MTKTANTFRICVVAALVNGRCTVAFKCTMIDNWCFYQRHRQQFGVSFLCNQDGNRSLLHENHTHLHITHHPSPSDLTI